MSGEDFSESRYNNRQPLQNLDFQRDGVLQLYPKFHGLTLKRIGWHPTLLLFLIGFVVHAEGFDGEAPPLGDVLLGRAP